MGFDAMLLHAKSPARVGSILGLVIALLAGFVRAEMVVRRPSEGDDALMTRVLGSAVELAEDVVRSTELAGGKVTLIAFAPNKDEDLVGHLLIERSPGHFEHVTFPSCDVEGAAPELLAVFFARTAQGRPRDLAVLCRWEERHAIAQGTIYGAEFYRVDAAGPKAVVAPLAELNKKFVTGGVSSLDERGRWSKEPKAKFTTVAGVKKVLEKMGLKQSP
jgi:hypothetical protein